MYYKVSLWLHIFYIYLCKTFKKFSHCIEIYSVGTVKHDTLLRHRSCQILYSKIKSRLVVIESIYCYKYLYAKCKVLDFAVINFLP